MIEASCHCGAVVLEVDDSPPVEVNDCHCSICRRYGALWAYYAPQRVRVLPAAWVSANTTLLGTCVSMLSRKFAY